MHSVLVDGQQVIPSKIVCIGRNYVEHISELGNEVPDQMVVFVKPNSAISEGLLSFSQEPLHYEGELCFLYTQGKFSAVGFGLDLTKRDLQSKLKAKGLPWERAKGFDGAALFSEFISIDAIKDDLNLTLTIDGQLTQQGGVSLMMIKPAQILTLLQSFMTLEDGDIVMTGTPKGVGPILAGSTFSATVRQGTQQLLSATWQAI